MITHLKFVSIPVTDQARSLKFYRDRLGFEVVSDTEFSEAVRWLELQPRGAKTRIVLFPSTDEFPIAMPNAVFACDDIQKTYDDLSAKGVRFVEPPTEQHGGTFATFADPDGNTFVLAGA